MGPLRGVRIIEFAGIGPGPFCAMLLADLGATVLRIDRKDPVQLGLDRPLRYDIALRNRKALALDLKRAEERELALELIGNADGLIEGFRPGTMERMGLGPRECLARNPRIVFGRMTGWGQSGPLALAAAHDINYIALTGALASIGRSGQPPSIPLNLAGDLGGGSLFLAMGMLAAMMESRNSGHGQVVDAAIVDGTASLMTPWFGMYAAGMMSEGRGNNFVDGGAPFYDSYPCADGKWVSIGPLESRFYAELVRLLELDASKLGAQFDRSCWPEMRRQFAERFAQQSRSHWCALLEGTDACFAPVLDIIDAPLHPHMKERGVFVEVDGVIQPMPAPRFSRTPTTTPVPFTPAGPETAAAALEEWLPASRIASLRSAALL